MKKELLEIKRTLTIDRYNITRITGYIVDNDRNCRLEFVKNFLNLEETETFKYLDILKKVLSGKPGRNMFQLEFKEKTRKQHLDTIVKTGLEDNDVRQIFLEEIAESIGILNKEYSLILIASGIYDIPGIATDGADLDESEEVYEYMIGCICPVSLSAAGLSYKPELADIQERTRDWVVSMPTQGFLYPAFTDRHGDPEHIWYYSKVPDKPDAGLITQTLRCGMPSTPKEQKEAFREGLNAADGKVSLEQAKDIYHYLGKIREIKAESNNRILKGAELENVLKSIGIDPELAAEKTKDCDAAEIDADNTVSTKTWGWTEETVEAIEMGIHALEETKWIPCSEKMPEDNTDVIVCFYSGTVTEMRYWGNGIFQGIYEHTAKTIVAWMPLPEPYKEKTE